MSIPKSFLFNDQEVYLLNDLFKYKPVFFKDCGKSLRKTITVKKLNSNDFCWAFNSKNKWKISTENYSMAKILIKKHWVENVFPELKNEVNKENDVKENDVKEDDVKGDDVKVNDVKEDDVKEDDVKEDDVKEDDVKGDDVKEDDVKVNDVKEDDVKEDDVNEDDVKGDDVKEDDVKGDDVKVNDVKEDDVKEDDVKKNKNLFMFLDVETTGLPVRKGYDNYYPFTELTKYDNSRIVEIAYIICDEKGKSIKEVSQIIKPDNFKITNSQFHGITNEIAETKGKNIKEVMHELDYDLRNIKKIIAYNINFDVNIILSESHRIKNENVIRSLNLINKECAMELAKKFTNQRNIKLVDLYKKLFNADYDKCHSALYDTKACLDCYFKMKN